ncbi:hypothetical protein [Tenacibaculum finnmarkense]|uniref:hypothetical protein n=1 Tax=Tenacibaculum finnmarkense TaxID=2781243 RepID=UPI001EFBD9F9|nr:hypothetical protein [Tenacibaculum finnmarkense]MCG8748000.1 hypothetical protein [Tenacibaculum finnmarkense]
MELDERTLKIISLKGIKLQEDLTIWNSEEENKQAKKEVLNKFINVWGKSMASHFLSKYSCADGLIWALDGDNSQLFFEKY